MNSRNTIRTCVRRLAAAVCLFAFCFGPARFAPIVVAALAGVEGTHAVRVANTAAETAVVLHHQRTAGPMPGLPAHHHGVASGVVCLLGNSQNAAGDHTARFATGTFIEGGIKQDSLPLPARDVAIVTVVNRVPTAFPLSANTGQDFETRVTSRRCLRSTCLLI